MARYSSGNTPPLRYWNGIPIYATTIFTAVFVVGLILSAVLEAMRSPFGSVLVFTMPLTPAWSLWRLVTYVFVNPVNFFTPFSIFFFYWMSVGIETHLGRPALLKLLTLLALTIPVLALGWWLLAGVPSATTGDYLFFCGALTAFATLYPMTEAWGWIPFKWVAFACVACGSLMLLAQHDWVALSQLWASCAVAFAFVRRALEAEHDDAVSPFAGLANWWRRRKFRVVRTGEPAPARRASGGESATADELDRLLDKIAKSGIASLSAAERARLEKARQALMRKEER